MLLSAGEGSRLRPLTLDRPKPMLPIGGVPVLERNVRLLAEHGAERIVINLHYHPDAITTHFGDGARFGVEIVYSFEDTLLGTAGGLRRAQRWLGEEFFLVYGDNLATCDLTALLAQHRRHDAVVTMALYQREDPTQSGIVGLDAHDRIVRFLEKPRPDQVFSHWVNAGYLVANEAIFERIPPDGVVSDFGHDVFEPLIATGRPVYGYRMGAREQLWWIDTLADYERTARAFASDQPPAHATPLLTRIGD